LNFPEEDGMETAKQQETAEGFQARVNTSIRLTLLQRTNQLQPIPEGLLRLSEASPNRATGLPWLGLQEWQF